MEGFSKCFGLCKRPLRGGFEIKRQALDCVQALQNYTAIGYLLSAFKAAVGTEGTGCLREKVLFTKNMERGRIGMKEKRCLLCLSQTLVGTFFKF